MGGKREGGGRRANRTMQNACGSAIYYSGVLWAGGVCHT